MNIYFFFSLENACELEKWLKEYPALESILKWDFSYVLIYKKYKWNMKNQY